MRRPLVAGNWKMFKTASEARVLMSELLSGLNEVEGVDIVICPPFTSILPIAAILEGTTIGVGAQNMHWEETGAYTGEVSPTMLAEYCKYVIIGHSERRLFFGETDQNVNLKIKSALNHGLIPIFCVGETLSENEAGITQEVVTRQLEAGLEGIDSVSVPSVIIAYEPVWAIGTGRAATTEDANFVIARIIRYLLGQMYGEIFSQKVRILYGGSVKASNAADFFKQVDIDGALVGGASLKPTEFVPIVKAAAA
jgi:triosephosphate isomerase